MELTERLKGWLLEHEEVPETASEDEYRAAATAAIAEGRLTAEKLHELTDGKASDMAEVISDAVVDCIKPLAEKVEQTADRVEKLATDIEDLKKPDPPEEDPQKRINAMVEKAIGQAKKETINPAKLFNYEPGAPRLVPVKEQYSHSTKELFHSSRQEFLANQRASYADTPLSSSSEMDLAVCSAYFKWAMNAGRNGHATPHWARMTDHDRDLMEYAMHESRWSGIVGRGSKDEVGAEPGSPNAVSGTKLSEFQRKALLDDSTSGGLEAAPIEFDAAIITTPVLHGELFPLVSVVPVSRGRRIEGFSISNPSFTSGTAEGTAISLFNTATMVSAFDTTIYNAVGAMEIGQDFESDSPVNMGSQIVALYGEKAKEWLDNQIANGDGTTEPQGLFNASGITDIGNPAGGANAAPQADDYITLAFNVAKQYRNTANRPVYVANDTSYRRARAIQVGAADERRVFGMNLASYDLFEWPYKVQNDIANTYAGFFCMRYYRMYRRLGLTVRIETGGKELALKNLTLIVVRMRWGGKLELGGAGAYSDNWQT